MGGGASYKGGNAKDAGDSAAEKRRVGSVGLQGTDKSSNAAWAEVVKQAEPV